MTGFTPASAFILTMRQKWKNGTLDLMKSACGPSESRRHRRDRTGLSLRPCAARDAARSVSASVGNRFRAGFAGHRAYAQCRCGYRRPLAALCSAARRSALLYFGRCPGGCGAGNRIHDFVFRYRDISECERSARHRDGRFHRTVFSSKPIALIWRRCRIGGNETNPHLSPIRQDSLRRSAISMWNSWNRRRCPNYTRLFSLEDN